MLLRNRRRWENHRTDLFAHARTYTYTYTRTQTCTPAHTRAHTRDSDPAPVHHGVLLALQLCLGQQYCE